MTEPEIQRANGNTYVSAEVQWQTPMRCLGMFNVACTKLYEQYKREMKLKTLTDIVPPEEVECTNCIETLCVVATRKVQIRVKGEDDIAEMIARQVYSGLDSPSCWEFDMHKYDK
jgi:hypothetical protein